MKAKDKRIAAQQRNIEKKRVEKFEMAAIRRAQACANDHELKRLCLSIAILQVQRDAAKSVADNLKALHERASAIYKAFRALPAHRQPAAWSAGRRYVETKGDVTEFLKFKGMGSVQSGEKQEQVAAHGD